MSLVAVRSCEASGFPDSGGITVIFQRQFEGSLIRISHCSNLILITPRCISRRLIGSGLFELALIIGRWAWTQLIQSCGFGLDPTRIMTSSSNAAAEQSLAADGATACFSSNFFPFSLNADRAPQLKASVRCLRMWWV